MATKKIFTKLILCLGLALAVPACGGGGGGGGGEALTGPASADLNGNFRFVYTLVSQYTDKFTFTGPSGETMDEGTEIYMGFNADYAFLVAAGAWYPSRSEFLVVGDTALEDTWQAYAFTIGEDGALSGCYYLSSGNYLSSCYPLDPAQSHKFERGQWRTAGTFGGDGGGAVQQRLAETGAMPAGPAPDDELAKAIATLGRELQAVAQ